MIGEIKLIESNTTQQSEVWCLKYSKQYFDEVNKLINKYKALKKAFNESGSSKLDNLIPEHWLKNDQWKQFIKHSLDFFDSL